MPVPCFSQCAAHTHHTCSHCRVAFYTQLRFVNRTQKACSFQQLLRIIRSAQVGSTLVCKLYPARYGQAEDVMTASLSSRTQQILAVDISELDSKLNIGTGLSWKKYHDTGSTVSGYVQAAVRVPFIT